MVHGAADAIRLPGVVEYALVDTDRFRPSRVRLNRGGPLVVGRHSRDDRMKFHPNDPAFYRRLAREGHRIRIVGGSSMSEALAYDLARGEIALLPERRGGMAEFLDGLDCFVYRVHPQLFEAGGTAIHEAMSMALPVIVFGERVGVAELIEHGKTGYLVDNEEDALECIRSLARDPELRRAIGDAARASMIAAMRRQRRSLLEHYVASNLPASTPNAYPQR